MSHKPGHLAPNAAGHVASIASSNTNGASMSYTYDSLNRLSTVVDNRLSGSNTTAYSYDDASNVGTVTYPNGVQSTFTYDTLNRVSGLSSQVSGYTYQRSPTGDLTSATESNGRAESWSYDGIYRLTNETISLAPSGKNGSVGYGLDPVGNRTSDTSSLSGISSGSFSFNADDELASESYDQNGNVTATGGKSFTYDSENHLTSMTASGTSASILYDGFGNRVSKTVNGVTTKYLVEDDVKTHSFWWVQDRHNQWWVLDGGPALPAPIFGFLVDWITSGYIGHYPEDNAETSGTWFDSGCSAQVCNAVDRMINADENWPPTPFGIPIWYNPLGPNSNSFARYIGQQGGFNPSEPPGAVGWGVRIP